MSYFLPYKLQVNKKTKEYEAVQCFHNPTMLYGTLEYMSSQKNQFNFYWVGGVTTATELTQE